MTSSKICTIMMLFLAPSSALQPTMKLSAVGDLASETKALQSGTYTMKQKSSSRYLDASSRSNSDYVSTQSAQDNDSQKWVITRQVESVGVGLAFMVKKNTGPFDAVYTVQQKASLRYLFASDKEEEDYAASTRESADGNSANWYITSVGDGEYALQQASSARYLDAWENSSKDWAAVTRDAQDDSTTWIMTEVTPAPTPAPTFESLAPPTAPPTAPPPAPHPDVPQCTNCGYRPRECWRTCGGKKGYCSACDSLSGHRGACCFMGGPKDPAPGAPGGCEEKNDCDPPECQTVDPAQFLYTGYHMCVLTNP